MEESGIPELEEGEEDGVADEHPRHRGDYYWLAKPIKPIHFYHALPPQRGGMGELCKLPHRGLARSPRSSATLSF